MYYFPIGELFDRFIKWLKKPLTPKEHLEWIMAIIIGILLIIAVLAYR